MSSTTGLNEDVPAITADTEMTERERAIWDAAHKVGFKAGRNKGWSMGLAFSRAMITRLPNPSAPPALPEEQEEGAALPLSTLIDSGELGLTVRTVRTLQREGIHTIADIFNYNEEDLSEIRNLGPKAIDEMVTKLVEVGYNYRAS